MRSFLLAVLCLPALACTRDSGAAPERVAGTEIVNAASVAPAAGRAIPLDLANAPDVPLPVGERAAANVVVELEVRELEMPLASGATYTFWTFGGHVPGSFIRVRHGDQVEFHLKNHPDSKMPHNIDLHAVTGPGGGASSSFTAPGHETTFSFRALNPGLYVYHCATAPVGMHVANGMYGLILVEPAGGLPPVDRELYVMQGDFYTAGAYHDRGLQAFDLDKAIDERPTYVLFNGAEGVLTGKGALRAKVGERVRLFVGNGGPNLTSSFHVIGEIFDRVYREGGTTIDENIQTTLIPPGGAAIVELTFEVPGTYLLVDHALFRTFHKGAMGQIVVEGTGDGTLFTAQQADVPYQPATAPATAAAPAADDGGAGLYASSCAACHQPNGAGIPGQIPPLAGSDFLHGDKTAVLQTVIAGQSGPIVVNGTTYNGVMPPWGHLPDADLAAVLTFVRQSWGNHGDPVTPDEIAAARGAP